MRRREEFAVTLRRKKVNEKLSMKRFKLGSKSKQNDDDYNSGTSGRH